MSNSVIIQNQSMAIKEYQGQRVVTFSDIDKVHGRPDGTAKRNFAKHKEKFILREDYFEVSKKEVGTKFVPTYGFNEFSPKGILLTESGYLLLVKSFTDDLAWRVQRELVNAYFKSNENARRNSSDDILKIKRVETAQANANVRKANLLLKIADSTQTAYKQVLQAHVTKLLTGEFLLPLPKAEKRTYSATEIGKRLGISANKVGILTNKYNLKTEKYGEWVYDKAKSAEKQIQTFRYYENIIPVLDLYLKAEAVA